MRNRDIDSLIKFKDVFGDEVLIEPIEVYNRLRKDGFRIFGMDFRCILAMQSEYKKKSLQWPPSPASIKEAFK